MESNTDYIRRRLLDRAGIFDHVPPVTLGELQKTEWDREFELLMRNRLIMGALRYGRMSRPEKGGYNCVRSMTDKLVRYCETGNTEYLVDVANLALVEFHCGKHPTRHFHASDDLEHTERD